MESPSHPGTPRLVFIWLRMLRYKKATTGSVLVRPSGTNHTKRVGLRMRSQETSAIDFLKNLRLSVRRAEQLIGDIRRHREGDQPGQGYLRSEDDQLTLALACLSSAVGNIDAILEDEDGTRT